jgi:hypothetical protein
MPISEIRDALEERVLGFCWEQWSQLGAPLSLAPSPSPWAIDPEALLIFTWEVARADQRLFDATLDWLVSNGQLLSTRRLQRLAIDADDKALCAAALDWLTANTGGQPAHTPVQPDGLRPLFLDGFPTRTPDLSFAAHGWLRPAVDLMLGNSRRPDLSLPVNFTFQLRELMGVGTRAEVIRLLLGQPDAPTAGELGVAAGYTKRNVSDVLNALARSGTIHALTGGHEIRFHIDRDHWQAFLLRDSLPVYIPWVPLLLALRRMLRWLRDAPTDADSYALGASARDLLEGVRPQLSAARLRLPGGTTSATALDDLDGTLGTIWQSLGSERHPGEGLEAAAGGSPAPSERG